MQLEKFRENPKNRCYFCKRALFEKIIASAKALGIATVCEGSNADDVHDYRPGMLAIQELGIQSPLKDGGLSKASIRELSRKLNLPTAQKPSFACLASRIPYGEPITEQKLSMVEQGEQLLYDMGLRQFRVRLHQCPNSEKRSVFMARIEVLPQDFEKVIHQSGAIHSALKKMGFSFITLDLQGFRSGSLNEVIV